MKLKVDKTKDIILVGTYKGDQLTKWRGWYNYPISDKDKIAVADAAKITELWLFKGTKDERRYKAKFVGIKTREELIRDYGYPAGNGGRGTVNGRARSPSASKPHGDRYALFKTQFIYPHGDAVPEDAERVIIRIKDFARSPKVCKQLKAYLESSDRKDPDLAKRLPEIVTRLQPEQLHLNEPVVQMEFWDELGCGVDVVRAMRDARSAGKYTCLDFFAGSGLVSAAMAKQFETVWANDISHKKAMVFNANIKRNVLDVRPIEKVNGCYLPTVDLSWGSFPCQDLSLAGDINGLYASRSGLFWQWLRVMDEMVERPPVVVAENVTGLVSADGGKYYVVAHEELAKRGYNVGAIMLDAVNWVPQSRKRVFIVATKKGVDISAFTCESPDWCHPEPIISVSRKVNDWVWWKLPKPPNRAIDIADIIEFDAPCDDTNEQLAKLSLIPKAKLEMMRSQSKTAIKVYTGYRRTRNHRQVLEVRTDGIAGCLRTPCGGSSRQIVLIAENGNIKTRLLTIRETARLMGAPDTFKLPGSYNDGYMAMGDGVAFPVAKYLSENLLAPVSKLAQ